MNPSQTTQSNPTAPAARVGFKTFEDLEVYRLSREFRKALYAVAKRLPEFEKFGLANQIRRASVSLTNNIAEGHGRFHFLEQIRFTLIARGSLQELIDDLSICEDEAYLTDAEISKLRQNAWLIHRVMAGYLRYLRERKQGDSLNFHETPPAYGSIDDELEMICADESTAFSTLDPFNSSTHE